MLDIISNARQLGSLVKTAQAMASIQRNAQQQTLHDLPQLPASASREKRALSAALKVEAGILSKTRPEQAHQLMTSLPLLPGLLASVPDDDLPDMIHFFDCVLESYYRILDSDAQTQP